MPKSYAPTFDADSVALGELDDVLPEVARMREKGDCHSIHFFRSQRKRYLDYFPPSERIISLSTINVSIEKMATRILHLMNIYTI